MSQEINLDLLVKDLKEHLKTKHGIDLPEDKFKGVAFSALKRIGKVSPQDKYKTYEHIAQMKEIFTESLGEDVLSWEDLEYLTGNLLFAMRSLTRKSIDEIGKFVNAYNDKEVTSPKDVVTDLFLLQDILKNGIYETWKYLEKTQQSGAGLVSSRLLKHFNFNSTNNGGNKKVDRS